MLFLQAGSKRLHKENPSVMPRLPVEKVPARGTLFQAKRQTFSNL
jgi:hypothetical protein